MRPEGYNVAWNKRVGWADAPRADEASTERLESLFRDAIVGGKLIRVIPKTTFAFDGREDTAQVVPLGTRMDARGFASVVLVVRVHAIGEFASQAIASVKLFNASVESDDEATEFIEAAALASVSIEVQGGGSLLVAQSSGAIASHVRVVLEWNQGGFEAQDPQTITIDVDILGRTHSVDAVVPSNESKYRPPRLEPVAGLVRVTHLRAPHGGRGFHVLLEDQQGPDFEPSAETVAPLELPRAGAAHLEIIRETTFTFDGRAGSTQRVVLADRIDICSYEALLLALRLHAKNSWPSSATATLAVHNANVEPTDPGVHFAESLALASVTVGSSTSAPHLVYTVTSSLDAVASRAQLVLSWSQGADTGSAQTITFSADLLGRFRS